MITPQDFSAFVQGIKKVKDGYLARCPAHDDNKQSLKFWPRDGGGTVVWCYAGCSEISICQALNITLSDLYPEAFKTGNGFRGIKGEDYPPRERKRIAATYDYCDETGKLLYQSVRFEPKDFSQRQPDGKNWQWNLQGVRRVLYRLPELIADESESWVFITEGEKDVDNLRRFGLVATCNPQGAGKWRAEYNQFLKGRRVCILQDNDEPGKQHAEAVRASLTGTAEEVVILLLPNLLAKGDVSDWLDAGGTKDELLRLADEAAKAEAARIALLKQQAEAVLPTEDLPVIDLGLIRDLPSLTALAWKAIGEKNKPERLFRRARTAWRLEFDERAMPGLIELTETRLRYEAARAARWQTNGQTTKPPIDICRDMLATDNLPLPPLARIVRVPVFSQSGALEIEPGYQPDSQNYYAPLRGLELSIKSAPTAVDAEAALALIRDDLLCDFPFAEQSDFANALSLLLLPFVRDMIDGPTPQYLIEASVAGAGKGLLADTLLWPGTGGDYTVLIPARDDDEWRKRITTALVENRNAVLIDNVNHALDSAALAAALTLDTWNDRMLSTNRTVSVPVRCLWIATANNPILSEEIARRTIRIRLVPRTDTPQQRSGFKHASLRTFVRREQRTLIEAAHTLIARWINQGRPEARLTPIGSYEAWSVIMGGILSTAGVHTFLANYSDFQSQANLERDAWREFCAQWWNAHESRPVTVSQLLGIADQIEGFAIRGDSEKARTVSFSKKLRSKTDAVCGRFQIKCEGLSGGYVFWKLEDIQNS